MLCSYIHYKGIRLTLLQYIPHSCFNFSLYPVEYLFILPSHSLVFLIYLQEKLSKPKVCVRTLPKYDSALYFSIICSTVLWNHLSIIDLIVIFLKFENYLEYCTDSQNRYTMLFSQYKLFKYLNFYSRGLGKWQLSISRACSYCKMFQWFMGSDKLFFGQMLFFPSCLKFCCVYAKKTVAPFYLLNRAPSFS